MHRAAEDSVTGAGELPAVVEPAGQRARRRGNGERSGSGIGLTIARDLLVANGGRIEIERTGREGTTFLVTLPD
jgi:signal transduction histidine kinase